MSVVFADSSCDLSKLELKKLGIEIFDIDIVSNNKKVVYYNNNFNFEEFYENEKEDTNICYKEDKIKSKLIDAVNSMQDILILTPDKKFSELFVIITKILKEIDYSKINIEIVNSNNISISYGSVVYFAGILNSSGVGISELVTKTKKYLKSVCSIIVPQKLSFAQNIGNVSGAMLGLKPIIQYSNGTMNVVNCVKGKPKIIQEIINKIKLDGWNIADYPMGIAYFNNFLEAEKLQLEISKNFEDLSIWSKNCFVGLNQYFGKNSLIITYHKKV